VSLIRFSYGACACRAEDYETEESSRYVVSYEEMKAKAEEELVSPLGLFGQSSSWNREIGSFQHSRAARGGCIG